MDYLEMDVVVSKDKRVVIAHEPYMPANICTYPDGSKIHQSKEKELNLYQMDYEEIKQFNCGSKHPKFPEQEAQEVYRPLLDELFEKAESYCKERGHEPIGYTIELKSHPLYDEVYHPDPVEFAQLVLRDIDKYGVRQRCVLQSFDYRVLREFKSLAPELRISMLVSDPFDLEEQLAALEFIPETIGPHFELVDQQLIEDCHAKGISVVPWTVNEVDDMRRLIDLGVDGIITDYPNRKSLIVD